MILSARFLANVGSVNDYTYADVVELVEGDTLDIYFVLIDQTKDLALNGYKPGGRRYMPAASATLSATVDNIDDARKVTRACVQPFPLDPSIWKLSVMATDNIRGTQNLKLALSESGILKHGLVKAAIRVQGQNCV